MRFLGAAGACMAGSSHSTPLPAGPRTLLHLGQQLAVRALVRGDELGEARALRLPRAHLARELICARGGCIHAQGGHLADSRAACWGAAPAAASGARPSPPRSIELAQPHHLPPQPAARTLVAGVDLLLRHHAVRVVPQRLQAARRGRGRRGGQLLLPLLLLLLLLLLQWGARILLRVLLLLMLMLLRWWCRGGGVARRPPQRVLHCCAGARGALACCAGWGGEGLQAGPREWEGLDSAGGPQLSARHRGRGRARASPNKGKVVLRSTHGMGTLEITVSWVAFRCAAPGRGVPVPPPNLGRMGSA